MFSEIDLRALAERRPGARVRQLLRGGEQSTGDALGALNERAKRVRALLRSTGEARIYESH
jgi:hypothetical protein